MLATQHRPVGFVAVKARYQNTALRVDALHGVGFRALCSCGHRGPIKPTVSLARRALRETHEPG